MEVFISYSSKESQEAYDVKSVLQKNGISTWMAPNSIPPGSNYTLEIPKAIKACSVFLIILSDKAQNSGWVLAEVESAFKNGKVILPLQIEQFSLRDDFDFLLSRSQRIEAFRGKEEAMNSLVEIIGNIIGRDKSTEKKTKAEDSLPKKAIIRPITEIRKACDVSDAQKAAAFAEKFRYPEIEEKVRQAKENSAIIRQNVELYEKKEELLKKKIARADIVEKEFQRKLQDFKLRSEKMVSLPKTEELSNGDKVRGYVVDGKISGIAHYKWASGNEYSGDFVNGKNHGFGTYKHISGEEYCGEHINDERTGVGQYTWSDGERHVGQYVNGERHGVGKYFWKNGNTYIGDFVNNKRSGIGFETLEDNTVYKGDFVASKWEGLARKICSDRVFTGFFQDGRICGLGILKWSDEHSIEGEFKDNLQNGIAISKWKNGSVYYGEFKDGKINGVGKYIWGNGNYYIGHFDMGKKDGKGTYFSKEMIVDGVWADDQIFNAIEYDCCGNVIAEYKNGKRIPK